MDLGFMQDEHARLTRLAEQSGGRFAFEGRPEDPHWLFHYTCCGLLGLDGDRLQLEERVWTVDLWVSPDHPSGRVRAEARTPRPRSNHIAQTGSSAGWVCIGTEQAQWRLFQLAELIYGL